MIQPEKFDLDLGAGHWLQWTQYGDERCGGIITHTKADALEGLCSGAFTIAGTKATDLIPKLPVWAFSGSWEQPTLAPSFLCHCGDHGFIRGGKWVRA